MVIVHTQGLIIQGDILLKVELKRVNLGIALNVDGLLIQGICIGGLQ